MKHERHILIVANETVEGTALHEAIRFRARGRGAEVLVIAPALNTRIRHWTSDEDLARQTARERLDHCLARLAEAGIAARGVVGDADPLQAIADGLCSFPADEIVIATHAERRSHWLSRDVVERARARFTLPVHHVVVETATERDTAPRERRVVGLTAAACAALALVAPAGAKTVPTLDATVGPGFTISLRTATGKLVKTLEAGTYRIRVSDLSGIHDFHLTGPDVSKTTSVPGTGSIVWTVKLKKGAYTYVCDPHASSMRGSFRVK